MKLKIFEGTAKAWNKFLKSALKIASPNIAMAVSARTTNFQIGKTTSDILKSISGGRVVNLIEVHDYELRLKVV